MLTADVEVIDTSRPPTMFCLLAVDERGHVYAHALSWNGGVACQEMLARIVGLETGVRQVRIVARKCWSDGAVAVIPHRVRADEMDDSFPYHFAESGKMVQGV